MVFRKKILLIDHDPARTREVRVALEGTGRYVVREEHDERTALRAAHWFAPDLILLDFMTSAMEAAALARSTPLLCMQTLETRNEVASAGMLDGYSFFAGPICADNILRDIEALVA